MGREAVCAVTWKGRRFEGKAWLETASVLVRGAVRVELPFSAMTRVDEARGCLSLTTPDGTLVLELGADAGRWAERIRNPPSLADKLGVTAEAHVALIGIDDPAILDTLRSRARLVTTGRVPRTATFVIAAVNRAADLRRLARLRRAIRDDGAIWTIRPKGVSEVSEAAVRSAARAAGLVDVKVARVSDTHTAEKFVIPRAERRARRREP